jgi:hypothetical protein
MSHIIGYLLDKAIFRDLITDAIDIGPYSHQSSHYIISGETHQRSKDCWHLPIATAQLLTH